MASGLQVGQHFGARIRYTVTYDGRDVDGCHKVLIDTIFSTLGINDSRLRFADLGKPLLVKGIAEGYAELWLYTETGASVLWGRRKAGSRH